MTKVERYLIALAFALGGISNVLANDNKLAIYIQAQEYQHPVKLWQYYQDYWFSQGPYVEAAAKEALSANFGEVATCKNSEQLAQVMLWLRPRIFYNPQLQVFYAKVTAVAYSVDGKPIQSYEGEVEKHGFLDVDTQAQLSQVYLQAMQKVAEYMHADSKLTALLNKPVSAEATTSACAIASVLPAPKIQIMSFQ